jgi:hypothetical protein
VRPSRHISSDVSCVSLLDGRQQGRRQGEGREVERGRAPITRTGWVRIMPLAAEGKPGGRRAVGVGVGVAVGSGQWWVCCGRRGDGRGHAPKQTCHVTAAGSSRHVGERRIEFLRALDRVCVQPQQGQGMHPSRRRIRLQLQRQQTNPPGAGLADGTRARGACKPSGLQACKSLAGVFLDALCRRFCRL